MVQSRQQVFINPDRSVNQKAFLDALRQRFGEEWVKKIQAVLEIKTPEFFLYSGLTPQVFSLEMGVILFELNADPVAILSAFIFPFFDSKNLDLLTLEKNWGSEVAQIQKGVVQMSEASGLLTQQKASTDLDQLRKMFLSMVNDVRVVLVALAKQQVAMRHIKKIEAQAASKIAEGVMKLYAPLANRLGIGQLKWELEDRAFRQLSSEDYLAITGSLDSKRADREVHLEVMIEKLNQALKNHGVEAEIMGRVKHIYSIYKKMQKKHLGFEQLFDIQAMRILVKDISDCYRALGVVHQYWEPVPSEFDDYISSPKSNGYRSIHTVVKEPSGQNIEIQIRTYAMHEESEMGVAAHWRYKEGTSRDISYEHRMQWLRSLLDWQKELQSQEVLQKEVLDNRVYVATPQGKVIDLEQRATPIDFAYAVHSEIGHRCRGAKVHGHIVPLTYVLKTGDAVEILTSKESRPSRDWLAKRLGYAHCSRTRAKIAAWFRQHDKSDKPAENLKTDQSQIQNQIQNHQNQPEIFENPKPSRSIGNSGDFILEGMDNILISPAGCCRPVVGDNLTGYITQGKGVRVHRIDCHQAIEKTLRHPERWVAVRWSETIKSQYPVDLSIYAQDRPGLLRDLTAVIVNEKVSIAGMSSGINRRAQTASILMTLDVQSKDQALRLQELLRTVSGVMDVIRK